MKWSYSRACVAHGGVSETGIFCQSCNSQNGDAGKYENATLNEREKTHGDFAATARISQALKAVLAEEERIQETNWNFRDIQVESLGMICTKLARIMSGNPNDSDHWKDIAGYANLVSERLK